MHLFCFNYLLFYREFTRISIFHKFRRPVSSSKCRFSLWVSRSRFFCVSRCCTSLLPRCPTAEKSPYRFLSTITRPAILFLSGCVLGCGWYFLSFGRRNAVKTAIREEKGATVWPPSCQSINSCSASAMSGYSFPFLSQTSATVTAPPSGVHRYSTDTR